MLLPISTLAALCVLFELSDSSRSEQDLEVTFRQRSHSDWQNAWHQERYSRCRETLIKHLYWACEKDIYRLTRRTDPEFKSKNLFNDFDDVYYPWIAPNKAKRLLRYRRSVNRRSGSSITNECCKSTGCTWEEYAEYCPTNKRHTSYI